MPNSIINNDFHCNEKPFDNEFYTNLITKTVKHHSTHPDLFTGSHLLTV